MKKLFIFLALMLAMSSIKLTAADAGIWIADNEFSKSGGVQTFTSAEVPEITRGLVRYDPNTQTVTLDNVTIKTPKTKHAIELWGDIEVTFKIIGKCELRTTGTNCGIKAKFPKAGSPNYLGIKLVSSSADDVLSIYSEYIGILLNGEKATWNRTYLEIAGIVNIYSTFYGIWGLRGAEEIRFTGTQNCALTISGYVISGYGDADYPVEGAILGCSGITNFNDYIDTPGVTFTAGKGVTESGGVYSGEVYKGQLSFMKKYPLWIAGTQVTSYNASKITGTGINGTISYNPDKKQLRLQNALIDSNTEHEGLKSEVEGLTIEFAEKGQIFIANKNHAISLYKNTTIKGTNESSIIGTSHSKISQHAGIYIQGATLTVSGDCTVQGQGSCGIAGKYNTEELIVKDNSRVYAYGIKMFSLGCIGKLTLGGNLHVVKPYGAKFDNKKYGVVDATGALVINETVEIYQPSSYGIYYNQPTGGTIQVKNGSKLINSKDKVNENTELTVTVTPAPGYKLSRLTANEEDITETLKFIVMRNTTVKAEFESTVGLSDVEAARFLSVSPNPASDKVVIQLADGMTAQQVLLVDLTGKVMYQAPVTDRIFTIDLSGYTKGIYLLRVGEVARRLVVQ